MTKRQKDISRQEDSTRIRLGTFSSAALYNMYNVPSSPTYHVAFFESLILYFDFWLGVIANVGRTNLEIISNCPPCIRLNPKEAPYLSEL